MKWIPAVTQESEKVGFKSTSLCGSIIVSRVDDNVYMATMVDPEFIDLRFTVADSVENCQQKVDRWLFKLSGVLEKESKRASETT